MENIPLAMWPYLVVAMSMLALLPFNVSARFVFLFCWFNLFMSEYSPLVDGTLYDWLYDPNNTPDDPVKDPYYLTIVIVPLIFCLLCGKYDKHNHSVRHMWLFGAMVLINTLLYCDIRNYFGGNVSLVFDHWEYWASGITLGHIWAAWYGFNFSDHHADKPLQDYFSNIRKAPSIKHRKGTA